MPKKYRLTGAQIRSIRSSRRIHGTYFSLSISPSPTGAAVCACVVSKKVSVRAVVRNLVKRRCRAALRTQLPALPAGSYIFHAKKEAASASYVHIAEDIARLVGKI